MGGGGGGETELRKALSDLTLADHNSHIHNVAALVPVQSICMYQLLYKCMQHILRKCQ